MNKIRLVYIDDQIDPVISKYLYQYSQESREELEYSEILFDPKTGYEEILRSETVRSANIIIIDDKLFEDRMMQEGKVTGEEFKIVLKKYQPFTETIVITQNKADEEVGTLPKFKPEVDPLASAEEYYQELFSVYLEKAIQKIKIYRKLNEKLQQNSNWETVVQERIINSLQGKDTYDALTKADIDSLVHAFQEVERLIDDGK